MSINAMKWAKDQKVGSCSAKFILRSLADYADVTGACWPSQQTLADETEQSVASVQRCLRLLEERGLIYIGPRRVKKNGHAGTREYVVLHDSWCVKYALEKGFDPDRVGKKSENLGEDEENAADQEVDEKQTLQIAASGENAPEENQIDGEKANENRHVNLMCQEPGAQMLQIAVSADTSLAPYQEPPYLKDSPIVPETPSPAAALDDGSWLGVWSRVETLWPWTAKDAPQRVREKIRIMEPDERRGLVPAVEAYLADCRAKGKQPASPRGFFATDLWRDWALKARGGKGRDVAAPVFVRKGSDAWEAWRLAKGVESLPSVRRMVDGRPVEGWYFPTLFPPRRAAGPEPNGAGLGEHGVGWVGAGSNGLGRK